MLNPNLPSNLLSDRSSNTSINKKIIYVLMPHLNEMAYAACGLSTLLRSIWELRPRPLIKNAPSLGTLASQSSACSRVRCS